MHVEQTGILPALREACCLRRSGNLRTVQSELQQGTVPRQAKHGLANFQIYCSGRVVGGVGWMAVEIDTREMFGRLTGKRVSEEKS